MITEDYVSYEVAKLLKKKGFDNGICKNSPHYTYNPDGKFSGPTWDSEYPAPTLQMAMKWLSKIYHLEMILKFGFYYEKLIYYWSVAKVHDDHLSYPMDDPEEVGFTYERADTRKEACEGFIKYCCENLI